MTSPRQDKRPLGSSSALPRLLTAPSSSAPTVRFETLRIWPGLTHRPGSGFLARTRSWCALPALTIRHCRVMMRGVPGPRR